MILTMKSNSEKTNSGKTNPRAATAAGEARAAVLALPALPRAAQDRPDKGRWIGRRVSKGTRRDAILHSVGTVLRDSRLSSLTMQDIALQLGITKGNLYYYFKDKQDILFQCHMRCMDLSLLALHDIEAGQASDDDALRPLLIRHIGGMLENGFGSVMLTDLDNLTPQQRSQYVARRDEFEAGVRALIEAGIRRGIYACADVKLASLAMLGAINWIPKWYHPDGSLASDAVATGLTDFLMKALEVKTSVVIGPAIRATRARSGIAAKSNRKRSTT
jgi:AcrR family transcriptional regulator